MRFNFTGKEFFMKYLKTKNMTRSILASLIVTLVSFLSFPTLGFCPVFVEISRYLGYTLSLDKDGELKQEYKYVFDLVTDTDALMKEFSLKPTEQLFLDTTPCKISNGQHNIFIWIKFKGQWDWQKLQVPTDELDIDPKNSYYKNIAMDKLGNVYIGVGNNKGSNNLQSLLIFDSINNSWTKIPYGNNSNIPKDTFISGNFDGIISLNFKDMLYYWQVLQSKTIRSPAFTTEASTDPFLGNKLFTIEGKPFVLDHYNYIYEINVKKGELKYVTNFDDKNIITNFQETVYYLTNKISLLLINDTDNTLKLLKENVSLFKYIFDSLKVKLGSNNQIIINKLDTLKAEIKSNEKISYKTTSLKETSAGDEFLGENSNILSEQKIGKMNEEELKAKIKDLEAKITETQEKIDFNSNKGLRKQLEIEIKNHTNALKLLQKSLEIKIPELKIDIKKSGK